MVDSHVVKMVLESAQMLSTTHRILDNPPDNAPYYRATHANHPCSVWVRQSSEHYDWLFNHFMALCSEYTYRYEKIHKCQNMSDLLKQVPKNISNTPFVDPPSCMAEEFKIDENPVLNYQNYYKYGKSHIHKWKHRSPPQWIE
jgi:hypothetical protein